MNHNFKQSAPSVLLFLGYILYFVLLLNSTFSFSIIWMILLIYLWVISALFLNKYNLNSFLCVFSLSGFLVSNELMGFSEGGNYDWVITNSKI